MLPFYSILSHINMLPFYSILSHINMYIMRVSVYSHVHKYLFCSSVSLNHSLYILFLSTCI